VTNCVLDAGVLARVDATIFPSRRHHEVRERVSDRIRRAP